nr:Predicted membrane protein [Streptococcus thermophilus]
MTAPVVAPSPTQKPPRLVVPDLARGLALLGIGMANITTSWLITDVPGAIGPTVGGVDPNSVMDKIAAVFSTLFVHVRGLPMFSTLLGFGVGLLCLSLERKNYPAGKAKRVLARRYFFLALFGVLHMFLLYHGDIMFTYGLAGMIMALLITVRTKILRIIAYVLFLPSFVFAIFSCIVAANGVELIAPLAPTSSIQSVGDFYAWNMGKGSMGALIAFPGAIAASIQLLCVMLIGFIWAREGVLADVASHRRTLITWACITVAVMLFLGLPWGLGAIGVFSQEVEFMFYGLNMGFGLLTGPGILAIIALLVDGYRPPAALSPFIALGKRSMSGYLAQSILIIVAIMPFTLGLGQNSTVAGKLLIVTGVWLITVILAMILEATNTPGPFEWVHRRLAYGRTGKLEPYAEAYNGPHDAGQAPGEHARRPVGEGRGAVPTPPPGGQFEVEGGGHR